MSTLKSNYYEVVSHLPPDADVTFRDVSWEEYEDLLEQVGEASWLRISYDDGTLQVMTISAEHESYACYLEKLMGFLSIRFHISVRSFGSMTMRKQKKRKGNEPDGCFYVQSADKIGNRMQLDFATDPPPDIAVEVDIHHDSRAKLPIYAALGVPEIWRFDGEALTILLLEDAHYIPSATSAALPMLTAAILTDALTRLSRDGELQALLAFNEWLQAVPS